VRGSGRCRGCLVVVMRLQVGVALVFFLGLRQASADINSLGRVSTEAPEKVVVAV
jgi:hypothetical protein